MRLEIVVTLQNIELNDKFIVEYKMCTIIFELYLHAEDVIYAVRFNLDSTGILCKHGTDTRTPVFCA
jgi:hypothetical protein